jgi:hypothetical protein
MASRMGVEHLGLTEIFIVRIYRRNSAGGMTLVGTVEAIASRRIHKFDSYEELRNFLEVPLCVGRAGRRGRREKAG